MGQGPDFVSILPQENDDCYWIKPVIVRQTFRHTCAVMHLRNGGDAFSLQKLLGHSSLDMTRRYAELAQADVIAKHRAASPGDRFLPQVQRAGGRTRLRPSQAHSKTGHWRSSDGPRGGKGGPGPSIR